MGPSMVEVVGGRDLIVDPPGRRVKSEERKDDGPLAALRAHPTPPNGHLPTTAVAAAKPDRWVLRFPCAVCVGGRLPVGLRDLLR